jgi:predicted patatin/cPLA2 family phospholipase
MKQNWANQKERKKKMSRSIRRHKKIAKAFNNKVYVFEAIMNDVKQIKKNKDLSKTFKENVFKSLKVRLKRLLNEIDNHFDEMITIWTKNADVRNEKRK